MVVSIDHHQFENDWLGRNHLDWIRLPLSPPVDPLRTRKVFLDEENVTGLPPHQLALRGLSRSFQNLQVFFGDLQRTNEIFIEEDQLKLALTTNAGIMYFRKR